jgi:hypothetical protein
MQRVACQHILQSRDTVLLADQKTPPKVRDRFDIFFLNHAVTKEY